MKLDIKKGHLLKIEEMFLKHEKVFGKNNSLKHVVHHSKYGH